jgi:hypothetical protein
VDAWREHFAKPFSYTVRRVPQLGHDLHSQSRPNTLSHKSAGRCGFRRPEVHTASARKGSVPLGETAKSNTVSQAV